MREEIGRWGGQGRVGSDFVVCRKDADEGQEMRSFRPVALFRRDALERLGTAASEGSRILREAASDSASED